MSFDSSLPLDGIIIEHIHYSYYPLPSSQTCHRNRSCGGAFVLETEVERFETRTFVSGRFSVWASCGWGSSKSIPWHKYLCACLFERCCWSRNEGVGRMRLEMRKRRNIRVMFWDCHCGQQSFILPKHPKKHIECLSELTTQWLGGRNVYPLTLAHWSTLLPALSLLICKVQENSC